MAARPRIPSILEPQHVRLLLAVRTTHHWTQHQLALELGVSTSTIANWESGRCDPHQAWLSLIKALAIEAQP